MERDCKRCVLHKCRSRTRPKLCDEHGAWTADYIRLRFKAVKEG